MQTILDWFIIPLVFWIIVTNLFKTCRNWYTQYTRNNSIDNKDNSNILDIKVQPCEPTVFRPTPFQVTSFGIDPEFQHFLRKDASHDLIPKITDEKDLIIYSVLQRDRFHLKVAHKEERAWGSIFIRGSVCTLCHKKLYLYGLFATQYYFCFGCIRTKVMPIFIDDKLFHCHKIFKIYNVPDQLQRIRDLLITICFDIPQIINFQFTCTGDCTKSSSSPNRVCVVFECDKCPVQAEFKPLEIYQYLLPYDKTNKQLLRKISELEKIEEEEAEKDIIIVTDV